ncbi:MAG: DUF134 domain-containing protein [Candidatus Cloacimonadota bacterium]|nr:DUF134 domain-containing protein [Candidatus Cloacimonadota bacterium]
MTRSRKSRRIQKPPLFQRFKPAGVRARTLQRVVISVDEYEALRLADCESMEHKQAAEEMNISRPTFTRLIEVARKKVAKAIIEGKEIFIEGGFVDFQHNIFRCVNCGYIIQINFNDEFPQTCPECGSENLINLAQRCGFERRQGRGHGRKGFR